VRPAKRRPARPQLPTAQAADLVERLRVLDAVLKTADAAGWAARAGPWGQAVDLAQRGDPSYLAALLRGLKDGCEPLPESVANLAADVILAAPWVRKLGAPLALTYVQTVAVRLAYKRLLARGITPAAAVERLRLRAGVSTTKMKNILRGHR